MMKLSAELLEKFAKVLEKYDLAELRYEEEECELHIVRKIEPSIAYQAPITAGPMPQVISQAQQPSTPQKEKESVDANVEEIKAPIVGTAYLAPEPGATPFIKVGDQVKKDQIIMIIEAMKVMNQMKSPVSGTIKKILVSNGKPVEFGEVLVLIQKD